VGAGGRRRAAGRDHRDARAAVPASTGAGIVRDCADDGRLIDAPSGRPAVGSETINTAGRDDVVHEGDEGYHSVRFGGRGHTARAGGGRLR